MLIPPLVICYRCLSELLELNKNRELYLLIQSTINLLHNNVAYANYANEHKLDETLTKLILESATMNNTARLDLINQDLHQFINLSADLLNNAKIKPSIRSKVLLVLSNLSLFNISLRKSAANNEKVCQSVYHCLEIAIEEQLGPQNKIDILRLIQVLTYEKIHFNDWVYRLQYFIISQILNSPTSELLPNCMCILCNLVSQSKVFTNNLKQLDTHKTLCARILKLLSHDSKAVVISALVLNGYLDEKTRDTVYSSQNLGQTFLCIFNILNTPTPDVMMTTHIAVDLLKKLVICRQKIRSDPLTLNETARNLTSYSFFDKSIQKLASLMNILESKSEEARKITELILSFCKIDELKRPICMAITTIEPTESKLATPLHALLRNARMTFEDGIFPELPLNSLQLLTINIKQAIYAGKSIRKLLSPSITLFSLVKETLDDSKIQTKSPLAPFQALKIAETLKLIEVLSNDEEIRFELLDLVTAQQYATIFEQQMNSNPITFTMLSPNFAPTYQILQHFDEESSNSSNKMTNFPLWSINAVSIPIQLMRILASLKDYSKPHKELYWRSLKDTRLLPFIAYSIARGDHELIHDAFVLLTHCAQVHEFPLKMLSNLTLKCATLRNAKLKEECKNKNNSFSSLETSYEQPTAIINGGESRIEELVRQIESFKEKLAKKEKREKELEEMLLQQQGTRENIQHFVNDLQKCVIESEAKEAALNIEKDKLNEKILHLEKTLKMENKKLESLEREKKLIEEENEKERALHSILRGKFDEMTQKFDTAAKAAFEKQVELEKMQKTHFNNLAIMEESSKIQMMDQKQTIEAQHAEIVKISSENRHLAGLKEAMEKLLGAFGAGRNGK